MGYAFVREWDNLIHTGNFSEAMVNFNLLDAGFGILILLFLVRGLLRGMIQEIAGFIGIFLGFFLAGRYYPQAVPLFADVINSPEWATGASYISIFALVLLLVALASAIFRKFLHLTLAGWLDYLLGAVIGTAKGIFVCAVALAVLQRLVPKSQFLTTSLLAARIAAFSDFVGSLLPPFL
ncbi:MAG: CvpA family protein [Desulfovibrio sp.]|jgi:membrane protein required for colicin V production|nr:CvpA family protein [Desulfovibrio sp.]